jgi:hypothetical protein
MQLSVLSRGATHQLSAPAQVFNRLRVAVPHQLNILGDLSPGKEMVLPHIVRHRIARRRVEQQARQRILQHNDQGSKLVV